MPITASESLDTVFGAFTVNYHEIDGTVYVSLVQGDVTRGRPLIRVQSACLFGEAFHSTECDCASQLAGAMASIERDACGVIVYAPHHEGRGAGLKIKILAMQVEHATRVDAAEAFRAIGLDRGDYRDYAPLITVLWELRCSPRIKSFGNAEKLKALSIAGFDVQRLSGTLAVQRELAASLSNVSDTYRGAQLILYENDRPLLYTGLASLLILGLFVGYRAGDIPPEAVDSWKVLLSIFG